MDVTRTLWKLHILNLPTSSTAVSALSSAHPRPHPRPHHGRGSGLLLWLWSLPAMVWHTLVDAALLTATAAFLTDLPMPLKASPSPPREPARRQAPPQAFRPLHHQPSLSRSKAFTFYCEFC